MNERTINKFITAANSYDTQTVLDLFAVDAVIDDVSVGEKFQGLAGIKKYFTTFFIGYHTKTEVLSLAQSKPAHILANVDFTGDFGHETGGLDFRFGATGLIVHIDAFLN